MIDTLGHLYARIGLVGRAISLLEQAHAALPGLPEVTFHLALAYRDAGRDEEARRLLTELQASGALGPDLREHAEAALASMP